MPEPVTQSRRSPATVLEVLAQARRRRSWSSALESLALGLAAAGAGAAAAQVSGSAQVEAASLWACGCLCGASMAGTWWVERAKLSDLDLARRLDRKLEADGALATAFEASRGGTLGSLGALLERRVLDGLDANRLRSALPSPGWIWLAPPALGAALLALAMELPPSMGAARDAGSPGGFEGARSAALGRAQQLLERTRADAGDDAVRAAELVGEVDRALQELQARSRPPSADLGLAAAADELSTRLQEQRKRLVAALGQESQAGAPQASPAAGAAGGGIDSAFGQDRDSGLAIGSPDRTMAGSNPANLGANRASPEPLPGEVVGEAGTLAGRWWPERYDPVVQGWRRALAAQGDGR